MTYREMMIRMRRGGEPWAIEQGWDARRWTRRGARNFLLRCWAADYGSPRGPIAIAEANLWAASWAQGLGFRIPPAAFDRDRARVLRLAAKEGVMLARDFPAIYRWATRARR